MDKKIDNKRITSDGEEAVWVIPVQRAPPPHRPRRSATPPIRKIHALGALRSIRSSLFTKPHEHLYDDLALRYL